MASGEPDHWLVEREAIEALGETVAKLRLAAQTASPADASALLSAAAGADDVLASLRL